MLKIFKAGSSFGICLGPLFAVGPWACAESVYDLLIVCDLHVCAWYDLDFFIWAVLPQTWSHTQLTEMCVWFLGTMAWEIARLPSWRQITTECWKTCRWCSTTLTLTRWSETDLCFSLTWNQLCSTLIENLEIFWPFICVSMCSCHEQSHKVKPCSWNMHVHAWLLLPVLLFSLVQ